MRQDATEVVATLAVTACAAVIAVASARPIVESWNDGSRLATVESLVDRHTFAIDESIFVAPPAGSPLLIATQDKVRVDGRFYSDKPPVQALWLAAIYGVWRLAGGTTAATDPGRFVWWMTLASSGLAYGVAVLALFHTGRTLHLSLRHRLLIAASFGLATVALPYARAVNGHEMLLGAAAVLFALLAAALDDRDGGSRVRRLAIGALAGIAYTLDLAAGPLLLLCALAVIVVTAGIRPAVWVAAGAAPWLLLHHAITYAIAGTLLPINAVPANLAWPGNPFAGSATGALPERSLGETAAYALALLIGRRGFIGHNPTLFVALAGAALLRPRWREAVLLVGGGAWALATWLVYALLSRNYSGECVSVRWFVPLLVPAYLALALLLRERPAWRTAFLATSALGMLIAVPAWLAGPWARVPGWRYWPVPVAALAVVVWQARRVRPAPAPAEERAQHAS